MELFQQHDETRSRLDLQRARQFKDSKMLLPDLRMNSPGRRRISVDCMTTGPVGLIKVGRGPAEAQTARFRGPRREFLNLKL